MRDDPIADQVELHEDLHCRFCGAEMMGATVRAWYPVDEGQEVAILGATPDGEVRYEYEGNLKSGESGATEEYWCMNCDRSARSLEFLLGLTDQDSSPDTITLSAEAANTAADACELLAGIDEGENFDDEELKRVCEIIRSKTHIPPAEAPVAPPRFLTFRFDVTGLNEAEVAAFSGAVEAQHEAGDDYPDVPAPQVSEEGVGA